MKRIYEQQCRRGPKPYPWERFYLKDLPKRGPGSVIAVGVGQFISRRTYMLNMEPGDIYYTLRCRYRVREI